MSIERKGCLALSVAVAATAMVAFAFRPIPKESAKALGVTRGKPFSKGAVFISGAYVEPPYVIERWGTGIRINSMPVTGQVVEWDEFLKTQPGVKVTKTEIAVPETLSEPEAEEVEMEPDIDDSASEDLDDLFDDDSKGKRGKVAKKRISIARKVPPKPKVVFTYSLEGDFSPNEETKALVGRVNAVRTEIDRILRSGGFICFGDNYSRVTGDEATFRKMMEVLPEILRESPNVDEFRKKVRAANLVYLNDALCADLFNCRLNYRKLKDRQDKMLRGQKWEKELEELSAPLF